MGCNNNGNKGGKGMQLWPKLEFRTRTPFVATGGFWEGLNGSQQQHRKTTFRVSGHAHCVGRSGCGQQKIDAFGVVIRNIMIPFPLAPVIGPTGRAPQRVPATHNTNFPHEMDAQNKITWSTCAFSGSAAAVSN